MQLEFTVEDKGFEAALRSLDKPTARRVMKRALNDTANKARTMLADKARETYAVKKSGFKRNARLKRASGGNLAAYILVSGKANELKDFRVNPASYATGAARPAVYRAKVLQAGGLKALRKPSVGKAFMVRFKSGHVTIAEREGKARLPIKTLYSPSNPAMVGARRVYGVLRPEIGSMLEKQVERSLNFELSRGGGA